MQSVTQLVIFIILPKEKERQADKLFKVRNNKKHDDAGELRYHHQTKE